ncbi:hypothetical protein [Streptomyces sp. NPDC006691]|uniref:hypothetical protein n=1 Tax=Streptomyces sp. NPDC006691 TaxID=3364757 RepID=UPI00367BC5A0
MELTRHLWQGERAENGHHHYYDEKIPIVAVGLRNLRQHGPAGAVFLLFGRAQPQPLLDAIGNPRRDAADDRARERASARHEEYQAQLRRLAQGQAAKQAAEREARSPVCTGCGARFIDERWEVAQPTDWNTPDDGHPHLCAACKEKAVAGRA